MNLVCDKNQHSSKRLCMTKNYTHIKASIVIYIEIIIDNT